MYLLIRQGEKYNTHTQWLAQHNVATWWLVLYLILYYLFITVHHIESTKFRLWEGLFHLLTFVNVATLNTVSVFVFSCAPDFCFLIISVLLLILLMCVRLLHTTYCRA